MKQKRTTGKSPLVRLVGWHAGHDAATTVTTPPESGHRLAPGIASAAAVAATGLLGPAALAAPGDLDPSFADVGRWSGPDLDGPLWSLDFQANAIVFGGGEEYCSLLLRPVRLYGPVARRRHARHGILRGVARPDYRVRHGTAERRQGGRRGACPAARRRRQGPGVSAAARTARSMRRSVSAGWCWSGMPAAVTETGRSVLVEPGGRIVVAGARNGRLLVVRLLANGALDPAFGAGGVSVGSAWSDKARVMRAPGGGYRVMASLPGQECSVSGLTEAGTLDSGFGNAGVAVLTVPAPQRPGGCSSLAIDATGRLLLGGAVSAPKRRNGYVGRLLANGTQDPGFSPAPIAAQFRDVTALTVGPTGSIFVAGLDSDRLLGRHGRADARGRLIGPAVRSCWREQDRTQRCAVRPPGRQRHAGTWQ